MKRMVEVTIQYHSIVAASARRHLPESGPVMRGRYPEATAVNSPPSYSKPHLPASPPLTLAENWGSGFESELGARVKGEECDQEKGPS